MAAALLLGSQADQILAEDLSRPAGASLTDSRGASLELRGTVKFDARKGVAVFDANPEQKEALRAWTRARLGESVKVSFTLEDGPTEEVTVPLSMALPGSFQLAGISLPKDASAGRVSRAEEIAALRAKAEAGDVEAQLQLADESLYGAPMDIEEAVAWWRKAADQGFRLAQEALREMELHEQENAPAASHGGMRSSEGEGSESCPVRP